jgi:polyhydroxyalkanoate synthase subunit PhaC
MTDTDLPRADFTEAFREASALGRKVMDGAQFLTSVRDEEVAIATTEKDEIWRSDKVILYRYCPLVERKLKQPLLVVFSLVGNYRIVDLQEDRSLVRNLLRRGIAVYVIDWGHPSRADRFLGMDDYINDYLAGAVDAVSQHEGGERVNVLGICEGGTFSLCYAALHPKWLQNLILIVTPVDFHGEDTEKRLGHGFINMWTRNITPEDVDRLLAAHGNLPGELMGSIFASMTPMRTLLKYNLDLMEIAADKSKLLNFLRMEKWLADRPHHPGEVARQWIKDLYQDNKLIKGELFLGRQRVDLSAVSMPVLNIFANDDHIIPPAMTQNVGARFGTKDYTEIALPAGHMGVFVSGKAQGLLGERIATWLFAHQQTKNKS